jgi:hypothetical protein
MGRSHSTLSQRSRSRPEAPKNDLLAKHAQTTDTPSCPRCGNSTTTEGDQEDFLCRRHLDENATPQQLDLGIVDISLSNQNRPDFEEERIERRRDDESLTFENQTVRKPFGKGKTRETNIRSEEDPLTVPKGASIGERKEVDHSIALLRSVRRKNAFSLFHPRNSSE